MWLLKLNLFICSYPYYFNLQNLSSLDLKDPIVLAVTTSFHKLFQLPITDFVKEFELTFCLVCDLNSFMKWPLVLVTLDGIKTVWSRCHSIHSKSYRDLNEITMLMMIK